MENQQKQPLVSIVIANFNYGRFLEDALKSIFSQSCSEYEVIVVDGGSKDNSVEIIKKYAGKIAWWCSEPDKGQSNAFNKGFSHAKGRFLTWLNADDLLLPDTIQTLKQVAARHSGCEWFTGNYLQFRDDNKRIIFAPWGAHVLPSFLQTFNSPLVIFGPTTFWSQLAYRKVGPIDESLHYSMDTDYWLRMKRLGYQQRRINHCCWAFRMHDASKTAQYGGRPIDSKVYARWYEELKNINERIGYRCSPMRRLFGLAMRFFDFSIAVAIFRRSLVVGRQVDSYLKN